eukprot:3154523-Amphidinium_carterae.1
MKTVQQQKAGTITTHTTNAVVTQQDHIEWMISIQTLQDNVVSDIQSTNKSVTNGNVHRVRALSSVVVRYDQLKIPQNQPAVHLKTVSMFR